MRTLLMNGEWVTAHSKKSLEIINPSTAQRIDAVPDADSVDVDLAVQAARNAQAAWWKVPGSEKANLMHEVARRFRKNGRELSTLMTKETGKPLVESVDCIEWIAACFDYYAEVGRESRGVSIPPVAPHQLNFTIKEPYGVVAAIVPFNFPLLLMSWKVAPAIAAGNTIVCKPPHQNPLSNLLMAECYEVLPPGVINVVTGGRETGRLLVEHPEVDLIAFTGSTESGRKIAASAGKNLKKVNLEMGGIDPLIVFKDADLEVAMRGAAWARLLNAGQVCTSPKRIYVEAPVYDRFLEILEKHVQTLRVGDPMDPATDMGPMISEESVRKVEEQIARSVQEGARLVIGGKRISPGDLKGFYFAPTVLTNVQHGGIPTQEEIFGPVISLISCKDADEAIRWANDSKYGLGATVYTKSLETALKAMENIKAGTFWVNDPLTDNDAAPFGGMRWSGMGRELGPEGLDAFREPKHVHIDYVMERKNFWFPYKDRPLPSH